MQHTTNGPVDRQICQSFANVCRSIVGNIDAELIKPGSRLFFLHDMLSGLTNRFADDAPTRAIEAIESQLQTSLQEYRRQVTRDEDGDLLRSPSAMGNFHRAAVCRLVLRAFDRYRQECTTPTVRAMNKLVEVERQRQSQYQIHAIQRLLREEMARDLMDPEHLLRIAQQSIQQRLGRYMGALQIEVERHKESAVLHLQQGKTSTNLVLGAYHPVPTKGN